MSVWGEQEEKRETCNKDILPREVKVKYATEDTPLLQHSEINIHKVGEGRMLALPKHD